MNTLSPVPASTASIPSANAAPASWQGRALVSTLVGFAMAIVAVSGGVLWLSPPGRVANWTNWRVLGLTKHEWTDLHTLFALVFVGTGLVHVWLNWRPLLSYFRNRRTRQVAFRREWAAAIGLCVLVYGGWRAQLPPLASLLAWSSRFKESWEQPTARAPIAHAELLTLSELARQAELDVEVAIRRLADQGVAGATAEVQVQALAARHGLAPARLYDLVRGATTAHGGGESDVPGRGGRGPGGGPGQKTLAQFCAEEGLELGAATARLEAAGIRATGGQTLREIATNHGQARPYEILEILRRK